MRTSRTFALSLVAACSFDPNGKATGSAGVTTLTSTTGGGATATTGNDSTGSSSDTTGSNSASSSSTSSTSTPTSTSTSTSSTSEGASAGTFGGTTGGGTGCPDGPGLLLWVDDAASITPPMESFDSETLPPCGPYDPIRYAASAVDDEGTITWAFSTDGPAEIEIFGLVFDDIPGLDGNGPDPDSYHVSLDGAPEFSWVYGCDTVNWPAPQWGWIAVRPVLGNTCPAGLVTYPLAPGNHTVRLRNREGAAGGGFASIAAIYLAVTPAPDPDTIYDPTP